MHGISDAEIDSIMEARPFTSVGDFLRRTNVSRPVVEALAHAGAFDRTGGSGGEARQERGSASTDGERTPQSSDRTPQSRRDRLFAAMTVDPVREGQQLALPLRADDGPPGLRDYTPAEVVRAELEVTGLDASRHLLSFYDSLLADLGVTRSADLRRRRGDEWVMVAGVKVASQTPAVRSGQRIIFLTLDDATGPVDVTVFERVQEQCARTVFHSFLLAVWGRLRRTGVGGVSIAAEMAWDLTTLARARQQGKLAHVMAAPVDGGGPTLPRRGSGGSPRAYAAPPDDEGGSPRKVWHSSGGSSGW